jgi:hypothetical protein
VAQKAYPISPLQAAILRSAKDDVANARRVLDGVIAMALASVGAAGNLVDVVDGQMIVEVAE